MIGPAPVTRSVYPSGFALSTSDAPVTPPAAYEFWITIGWLVFSSTLKRSWRIRATTSVAPPGSEFTISVIGLEGYSSDCDQAGVTMLPAIPRIQANRFAIPHRNKLNFTAAPKKLKNRCVTGNWPVV